MSFFRFGSRKKLTITEKDPVHKVQYLGNVHTSFMRGEGCVDKALEALWRGYKENMNRGVEMDISVCGFGLKAKTKMSALVEYRAHRIPFCIAHPDYPKVFAWVYKHEGKKMRMSLRCHAVICKNQAVAKAMALKLHENTQQALKDFMREKNQKQRARLLLQRTNNGKPLDGDDSPTKAKVSFFPLRQKLKSTATNFKPSVESSRGAPRLRSISECDEPVLQEDDNCNRIEERDEEEQEEEEQEELVADDELSELDFNVDLKLNGDSPDSPSSTRSEIMKVWSKGHHFEIGNNIEELRKDSEVQRCLIYGDCDTG